MRFSWEAFDEEVVVYLARASGWDYSQTRVEPIEWMSKNYPPSKLSDLVKVANDEIIEEWANGYYCLKTLVRDIQEAHLGPDSNSQVTADQCMAFLRECKNTSRYREVVARHLKAYGEQRPDEEIKEGSIRRFCVIDTAKTELDKRKPWDYQETAWKKLSKFYEEGHLQGLLVMPTGSGKTYTACHWLLKNIIAKGGRILWIAHRNQLLIQTWHNFKKLANLAHDKSRFDSKIRMRIVSGQYDEVIALSNEDDIMLCSIKSLAKHKDKIGSLLSDPKLFVVIDEAHHSVAKTYCDIILPIRESKHNQLLGLTATPTRMNEKEREFLHKLYSNNYVYEVEFSDLVESGILSRPKKVSVKTGVNAEEYLKLNSHEINYFIKHNDLPPQVLNRLGYWKLRNQIVIKHYEDHKEEYGKTLVFATDVNNASLLTAMFKARGINAEYITSYRVDWGNNTGESAKDQETIDEFQREDSDLNVLINVEKLTEGVDLPCIQTVLLARPTNSPVLMQQMVGRALRGPKMGGTEYAYLVSFEDHWEMFTDLERPFSLIKEIYDPVEMNKKFTLEERNELLKRGIPNMEARQEFEENMEELNQEDSISMNIIKEFMLSKHGYNDIRNREMVAIPSGWFVLQDKYEKTEIIPVNEHEEKCWRALESFLNSMSFILISDLDSNQVYEEFFSDCDIPKPAQFRIQKMIDCLASGEGSLCEFIEFEERGNINPENVAVKIIEGNLGDERKRILIQRVYSSSDLAKGVYGSLEMYMSCVEDEIKALDNPQGVDGHPKGESGILDNPIEGLVIEPPDRQLLDNAFKKALEFGILNIPNEKFVVAEKFTYYWSKAPIRRLWGQAYYLLIPQKIRINSILSTPNISYNALCMVVWHEYIHLCLKHGKHNDEFYMYERLWPGYDDVQHELATLKDKYGIKYY